MTRRYPAYRAWPGCWLPEVPTHWTTGSFRHFADFTTGWTPPTGDDASYVGDNAWANIGDLKTKWISDTAKHLSDDAVEGQVPSRVGDLLFAFKLSVGAVSRVASPMFTNEAIATVRSTDELDLGYGYYAIPEFLPMNANTNIYGAPLLNASLMRSAAFAVPALDEQRAIADYLDRETARIDTLIAEQGRLIEMLRERRQAVLESTVAELNWDCPLASVAALIQTGPFGSQLKSDEYEAGGVAVINPSHLVDGEVVPDPRVAVSEAKAADLARHELKLGDVVVARRGELGRCAVVTAGAAGFLCGTGSALIRPNTERLFPPFLALVFGSRRNRDALSMSSVGATMDNLNAVILAALRIPLPPIDEQRRIVAYLDEQTARIDALIAETETFIELTRERRAALITAAVTGQIDVREVS